MVSVAPLAYPSSSAPVPRDDASVQLPPLQFACAWLAVLVVRLACVATLVTFSLTNYALATPEMEYYASLIAPTSLSLFTVTSWLAASVGLAHCYKISRMVECSIRAWSLTFHSRRRPKSEQNATLCSSRSLRTCVHRVRSALARVFGRKGLFGTESPHFEALFLSRELLEMVSQTVQVYSSSTLIARHWINSLFVTVVFINSFSTPLAQRLVRQSRAHKRLACLVADTIIDVIAAMVIPLIIIFPYYEAFDMETFMLEITILYDMSKFGSLTMEMRQIFVRNSGDLVMKVLPHLSIYGCMGSIQALLRPTHASSTAVAADAGSSPSKTLVKRRLDLQRASTWHERLPPSLTSSRVQSSIHALFFVWGCCVVVFHVAAIFPSYNVHLPGCKLLYRPWFSTAYSCSVYEYNCYRQGTSSPPSDANFLAFLDDSILSFLVLSHCPALVVPPAIQQFHRLIGFEVWNSTVVAWRNESGLTQQAHPFLQYTCLVDVNFSTGIPDGLLYDLPKDLYDIEIIRSNLTTLPDDLDVRWAQAGIIYIEHAQLTAMPPPFWRRAISDFSLVGNRITELPDTKPDHDGGFFRLALGGNPLTKLPEHIGDLRDLQLVALEDTQVAELPDWVYEIEPQAFKVFLAGTPFCQAKSAAEIAARFGSDAVITCVDTNPYTHGRYPTEKMRPLQQP